MLALHAVWASDRRLHLWAEDAAAFEAHRRRRDRGRRRPGRPRSTGQADPLAPGRHGEPLALPTNRPGAAAGSRGAGLARTLDGPDARVRPGRGDPPSSRRDGWARGDPGRRVARLPRRRRPVRPGARHTGSLPPWAGHAAGRPGLRSTLAADRGSQRCRTASGAGTRDAAIPSDRHGRGAVDVLAQMLTDIVDSVARASVGP